MRLAVWLVLVACEGCFEKPGEPMGPSPGMPQCKQWSPFQVMGPIDSSGAVNTGANEQAPWLSQDGQELWFSRGTDLFHAQQQNGVWLMAQMSALRSGTTLIMVGNPFIDNDDALWFDGTSDATNFQIYRATRSALFGDFVNPVPFDVGTPHPHEPALTADRLTLYYRETVGTGRQMMVTTRPSVDAPWDLGTAVSGLTTNPGFQAPSVSADGSELFFTGYPVGTMPQIQLGTVSAPATLTGYHELTDVDGVAIADDDPNISTDGTTLVFATQRNGTGGEDIFTAQRTCLVKP